MGPSALRLAGLRLPERLAALAEIAREMGKPVG
jgi:hypothetical protein